MFLLERDLERGLGLGIGRGRELFGSQAEGGGETSQEAAEELLSPVPVPREASPAS